MLMARQKTGGYIDAEAYRQLRAQVSTRKADLLEVCCPGCQGALIFKNGQQKIPHFAHRQQQDCQLFSEGETAEHLAGKRFLQRILPAEAQMEAYLPHLQQRPDLLWQRLAVEFQCSSLSQARFQERTTNYQAHGYQPWWLLGKQFLPLDSRSRWPSLTRSCVQESPQGLELWGLLAQEEELLYFYALDWHYRFGSSYQIQSLKPQDCLFTGLFRLGSRGENQSNPWQISEYKWYLQRGLASQSKRLLHLQGLCYQKRGNLLDLPDWCYLPGQHQFLLEQELLLLRFLTQTKGGATWEQWHEEVDQLISWPYPLVDKKTVLRQVYQESRRLAEEQDKLYET